MHRYVSRTYVHRALIGWNLTRDNRPLNPPTRFFEVPNRSSDTDRTQKWCISKPSAEDGRNFRLSAIGIGAGARGVGQRWMTDRQNLRPSQACGPQHTPRFPDPDPDPHTSPGASEETDSTDRNDQGERPKRSREQRDLHHRAISAPSSRPYALSRSEPHPRSALERRHHPHPRLRRGKWPNPSPLPAQASASAPLPRPR